MERECEFIKPTKHIYIDVILSHVHVVYRSLQCNGMFTQCMCTHVRVYVS